MAELRGPVRADLLARLSPTSAISGFLPARTPGGRWPAVLAVSLAAVLIAGVLFAGPIPGPVGLLLVALACAGVAMMLGSPTVAVIVLVLASFTRLALPVPGLPAEPMVLALLALVASASLAALRGVVHLPFGWIEGAMLAYLLLNVASMLLPHEYLPMEPSNGETLSVYRFIITGTLLPFTAFVVGRAVFRTQRAVRPVLYLLVGLAGYSALVSFLQFRAPALVWPRYIVESPNWEDRAVGIFNQPVVNGLVMVAGFITAMFLAQERTLGRFPRLTALLVAVLCVQGIYLTRTRAVWLVFGIGIVLCAVLARGARTGFVLTITGAVGFVAATWSTFTSSNRAAGGVGSVGEVDDRLNTIATSFWAIGQKPLFGWGIGRFEQVNTYHHLKFDQSLDFVRGYSIPSHENELGIAAELGLIGLALWFAVMIPILWRLITSLRRLPVEGMGGRPIALLGLTVFGTWVVCGFTVDLRFFDFANLLVFLLVGIVMGLVDALPRPVALADPITGRRVLTGMAR